MHRITEGQGVEAEVVEGLQGERWGGMRRDRRPLQQDKGLQNTEVKKIVVQHDREDFEL